MSVTNSHFECSICCSKWKISSRNPKIECTHCNYVVCKQCQKMYAKAECANCHTGFSHSQITNLLGKPFIRDVIIKQKKEELVQKEKILIPFTGKLIEYFDKVRQADELRGTGKKMELPPRPIITVHHRGNHYPCAKSTCKGYVTTKEQRNPGEGETWTVEDKSIGACCLCKTTHCNVCMENIESAESHTCNQTILEDIAVLEKTTKRCPTCFMRIHKVDGCDHMNCVSCGTHFSWNTGVVMPGRRGGGPNKQLAVKRGTMEFSAQDNTESAHLIETVMHVFSSNHLKNWFIALGIPEKTLHLCFTIPKHICMYCRRQELSHVEHAEKLDDIRVLFITNKITERQWGERLYLLYRKRQLLMQIIYILHDFLQKMGVLTLAPRANANASNAVETMIEETTNEDKETTNEDKETTNEDKETTNEDKETRTDETLPAVSPTIIVFSAMSKARRSTVVPHFEFMENSAMVYVEEANVALGKIHAEFHELDTTGEQFYIDPTFRPKEEGDAKEYEIPIFTTRFGKVPEINTNNTIVVPKETSSTKEDATKVDATKVDATKEDATKEDATKEAVDVKLYPYQIRHYDRMCAILDVNEYVIDNSPPGSGKTYTATKYLQNHPFDVVLIVCPNSLVNKWKAVQNASKVKAMVISYTQLTGRLHKHPNHGLLARYDYNNHAKSGRIMSNVQYTGTEKFIQMATTKRICCIFDEIQEMRNPTSLVSMASKKIITLLRNVSLNKRTRETEHKFMYLSGTPFDSERNTVTFLQTIGIVTKNLFVYHVHTQTSTPDGFDEAMRYYDALMPTDLEKETDPYWTENFPKIERVLAKVHRAGSSAVATPLVFELFNPLIMKRFGTSMIQPTPENGEVIHVINTYCALQGESRDLYEKIRNRSIELIRHVAEDHMAEDQPERITKIRGNAFELIALLEKCLIASLIQMAREVLRANPSAKVVIAATYCSTIRAIFEEMAEFEPVVLSGDVPSDIRHALIDAFQAPNTAIRVIIGNLSVISTGIDLDDKHGGFPRHVFIFPTYRIMDAYQFNFRFLRGTTTKTSTIIRYLYSDWNLPDTAKTRALDKRGEFIPLSPEEMELANVAENGEERLNIEKGLFSIVSKKVKVITSLNASADTIRYANECVH